ncbi:hypothetical protein BDY19DRAFT_996890 [Irpex rosettiformis]|uniref:Uncharacterized protein n=1 Tax=Irpex rosettiformis TaxID=378272 RepID=A0ACB8TU46_9APHY|nr:hypothetical protein BDY19DRAFT_996890 [Irpex rosettiformis]
MHTPPRSDNKRPATDAFSPTSTPFPPIKLSLDIPERQQGPPSGRSSVHAKAAGAHGYFEPTKDISRFNILKGGELSSTDTVCVLRGRTPANPPEVGGGQPGGPTPMAKSQIATDRSAAGVLVSDAKGRDIKIDLSTLSFRRRLLIELGLADLTSAP